VLTLLLVQSAKQHMFVRKYTEDGLTDRIRIAGQLRFFAGRAGEELRFGGFVGAIHEARSPVLRFCGADTCASGAGRACLTGETNLRLNSSAGVT
jgi:hypothetical protein